MKRQYRNFKPEETLYLHEAYEKGITIPEMARELDRHVHVIYTKLNRMGIAASDRNPPTGWTDEEVWVLYTLYHQTSPYYNMREIAGFLNRGLSGVRAKFYSNNLQYYEPTVPKPDNLDDIIKNIVR